MKIAIYVSGDTASGYSVCGRFLDETGVPTPVCFYGFDQAEVSERMSKWLDAERQKEADRDAAREYLRSPEMIEKRRLARLEAAEKRKTGRAA